MIHGDVIGRRLMATAGAARSPPPPSAAAVLWRHLTARRATRRYRCYRSREAAHRAESGRCSADARGTRCHPLVPPCRAAAVASHRDFHRRRVASLTAGGASEVGQIAEPGRSEAPRSVSRPPPRRVGGAGGGTGGTRSPLLAGFAGRGSAGSDRRQFKSENVDMSDCIISL